jgi:hypothetical protein
MRITKAASLFALFMALCLTACDKTENPKSAVGIAAKSLHENNYSQFVQVLVGKEKSPYANQESFDGLRKTLSAYHSVKIISQKQTSGDPCGCLSDQTYEFHFEIQGTDSSGKVAMGSIDVNCEWIFQSAGEVPTLGNLVGGSSSYSEDYERFCSVDKIDLK